LVDHHTHFLAVIEIYMYIHLRVVRWRFSIPPMPKPKTAKINLLTSKIQRREVC